LLDATAQAFPDHYVTSIHDLVLAVPERAKPLVDDWAHAGYEPLLLAAETARLGDGAEESTGERRPGAILRRLSAGRRRRVA
jgi:hypothetical protein